MVQKVSELPQVKVLVAPDVLAGILPVQVKRLTIDQLTDVGFPDTVAVRLDVCLVLGLEGEAEREEQEGRVVDLQQTVF